MNKRRDVLAGVAGGIGLVLFFLSAWRLLNATTVSLAVPVFAVIAGVIVGALPLVPQKVMPRYGWLVRTIWLSSCGFLLFWPGATSSRTIGASTALSVAAGAHFWRRRRSQKKRESGANASGISRNTEA